MLFLVNMIGLGAGPTLIGLMSDVFANQHLQTLMPGAEAVKVLCAKGAPAAATPACLTSQAEGLRLSLLWSVLVGAFAVFCFWMARKTISRELEDTAAEAKAA
jgi:hypothetical protein